MYNENENIERLNKLATKKSNWLELAKERKLNRSKIKEKQKRDLDLLFNKNINS